MFELAPTKLWHYTLPTFGALALLAAAALTRPIGKVSRITGAVLGAFAALLIIGITVYGLTVYGTSTAQTWAALTVVMALAASALAGMSGFWVYVLGFLLVQFGNNYATAPYSALIPQLVPVEQRGRYSGVMAMLQAGGQLLGAVAALLLGLLHLPGWAIYALVALVLLLPALVTMRGVPAQTDRLSGQAHAPQMSVAQLFAYQPFLWVFLTRVLFALGQYSVQPFLQYYNKDVMRQGDPANATSIMLACIIVGSIASALIGGRISDRVGRKPLIIASCLGICILMASLTFWVTTISLAYLMFFLCMVLLALRLSPFQTLLSSAVPSTQRGTTLSLIVAVGQIGGGIGGAMAGVI